MADIELTIKTLDSRNHKFTVSDQLTVKELKEHVAPEVGTPADTQRLIYCGRVLQDDKKLSEYDLNGKVVHLVQRAPPSVTSQPSGSARTTGSRPTNFHYHLDRGFPGTTTHTIGPIPPPAGSSSLLRLNTARHMLEDASQSLARISNIPTGDAPLFTMDNSVEGPYSPAMPFAQAATAAALAAAFSTVQSMGANNITVLQGPNGAPSVQGSFGFRVQNPQTGTSPGGEGPVGQGRAEPSTPSQPSENQRQQPQQQQHQQPHQQRQPPPQQQHQPQQQQQQTQQQRQPQLHQSIPLPQFNIFTEQPIRNPRVSVFADVIEDMERIQQDLRPHLTTVRQLLRDDPTLELSSMEYRRAQHTYNQVAECLHYLAHAFHAMSDLMVDFGTAPPREVRARPYMYQQAVLSSTIPIHASISVETTRVPTTQQPTAPTTPSSQRATTPTPASNEQPAPSPRQPTMSPLFARHVFRQPATQNGATPQTPPRAAPNAGASRPGVHMVHHPIGAHAAFGRLPMGPVPLAPMVYMEVRSNQDDQPSGQSPTAQGEFDDFLPCHSRHLRNARSDRRRSSSVAAGPAPNATATSATSTQASQTPGHQGGVEIGAAPMPSMMDFMNQLLSQVSATGEAATNEARSEGDSAMMNAMFSSLLQGVMQEVAGVVSGQQSPNTVAHFLRNIPDFSYTAGESFVFDLFMTMAEHLTFRDLMALFYGMPDVLNGMRDHLRTFALQRITPPGGDFSESSVRQGTMALVHQALPLLQSAAAEASVRPDVDFVATMGSFVQQRLHDIVLLVGAPGDNPNFGQLVMDQIRQSTTMGAALALACFTDGTTSLERVFITQLRGVSDGVHPAVQEWTTSSALGRLRTLMASVNLDQLAPTVAPLVMNEERGRAWRALFNAELEEMQEESTSAPVEESAESMEVVEDAPESTQQTEDAKLSRLERLRKEAAAKKNTSNNEPEPSIDVVLGSQSWHSQVPQEWVPVIARDIQRQNQTGPAGPLSDAYLAGIPNKRRKLAQGNRPNTNPQLLLEETVERAMRSANAGGPAAAEVARLAASSAEVGAALVPELRRLGGARLDRDPDFDAERFPNAERFFHGQA